MMLEGVNYVRLCEIMRRDTEICEPRKRLRGTFLCEVCELACEKVCADTTEEKRTCILRAIVKNKLHVVVKSYTVHLLCKTQSDYTWPRLVPRRACNKNASDEFGLVRTKRINEDHVFKYFILILRTPNPSNTCDCDQISWVVEYNKWNNTT